MSNLNLIKCDVSGCAETEERDRSMTPRDWGRVAVVGGDNYDLCPVHNDKIMSILDGLTEATPDNEEALDIAPLDENIFSIDPNSPNEESPSGYATCPSHCCQIHGCKYGYMGCPVAKKRVQGREYKGCEQCEHDVEEYAKQYHEPAPRLPGYYYVLDSKTDDDIPF